MRATTGGANAGLHRSGVRRGGRIVTRDRHELQRLWRLDGDYHARNIDAERRGNDAGRRWRRDLDGDGRRGERVDSADLREGYEVRYRQAQREGRPRDGAVHEQRQRHDLQLRVVSIEVGPRSAAGCDDDRDGTERDVGDGGSHAGGLLLPVPGASTADERDADGFAVT